MSANTTLPTGSSLCPDEIKALSLLKHTIGQIGSGAITLDELSRFNAHQSPFEDVARPYSKQIEGFQQYFQDRWDFKCSDAEMGALYVPRPRGYCKTLLVLPPAKVIAGSENICAKWRKENKFKVWTFTDGALNEKVKNDRRHLGMYALLHKGTRDADEELRNRSFAQNRDDGLLVQIARTEDTMRATEVLFLEDFNFLKTGEHLDPHTMTITSSLVSDGNVVYVLWDGGEVNVGRYDVRDASPDWASRAAVYL